MNRSSLSLGFVGSAVLVAGLHACSAGDVSSPRTGGTNSVGGSNSNGGSFGQGGSTSNGGNFNPGGSSNGGSTANGGGFGQGGTTNTGGASGAGTGSGGTGFGTATGGAAGSFTGTGGAPATGTGGSTGTGGGAPLTNDSTFAMMGYGVITVPGGMWQGPVYTGIFAGSLPATMISPVCGSNAATAAMPCFSMSGAALCVNGSVPADLMFTSGALLGWNIAQPKPSTTPATIATTGTGVTLTFSGTVGGFRVAIDDATTQWCFTLPTATGTSVTIPWTMFRTACYKEATDPTSLPYTVGTPIRDIQVLVPSTNTAAVQFNFCLVSVSVQ
jgi:hypothetical protein